ncbi:MAG: hypothetical protein OFPII_20340 [Osedax symbiont Rs1]|nr:MAG: hypothetical protein OFPII_20340 [Osedax symbiont Rs1]
MHYSAFLMVALFATQTAATSVFINELHYDNAAIDVGEAIEIAAPSGTDLNDWSVVLYNGRSGVDYKTLRLHGLMVADQCAGYGTVAVPGIVENGLQNGAPDGLALVNGKQVVQFLSYEGVITATAGPAKGLKSIDIGQRETSVSQIGESLQLKGTGTVAADFTWSKSSLASLGYCNSDQNFSRLSLTPQVNSVSPNNNATDVALDASIKVRFSTPVNLAENWYSLNCQQAGILKGSLSGGPTLYTLHPRDPFEPSDTCHLRINANQVTGRGVSAKSLSEDFQVSFMIRNQSAVTACSADPTLISLIQGSANAAGIDFLGTNRTVKAVLVANFQGAGLKGFYLQEEDEDQDGNALTSEGIFVYQGAKVKNLTVGDVVAVTGTVTEFNGFTQISNVTEIERCAQGRSVTSAVLSLPFPAAENAVHYLERFAAMQVSLKQPLTIAESYNYGRFGQLLLSNGRLWQPTQLARPGTFAQLVAAQNSLNQILLDDNDSQKNPYPITNPDQSIALTAAQTVRLGNKLNNDGLAVLNFSYGHYQLQPIKGFTVIKSNPRTDTLNLSGEGSLKIASFNVLNYFTSLDRGRTKNTCGPSANQGCRGADSAAEFERQRGKIIQALLDIDADIVGLMEIENNSHASLADLVEGLNTVLGEVQYRYLDTGVIGTDVIKVGFIYKTAKTQAVGDFAILKKSVARGFNDAKNRPSLIQTFLEITSNQKLTLAVNHFKSKGSSCDDLQDPDAQDGQGNCNGIRTQAAKALVSYLATDPTSSGDPDFLIIGDLNAYAKEDPIVAIKTAGYKDLLASAAPNNHYSYVFKGVFGYLDHALASASLAQQVTDVGVLHINADEPRVIDYNVENKTDRQVSLMFTRDAFRSSDHDPVVIELRLK